MTIAFLLEFAVALIAAVASCRWYSAYNLLLRARRNGRLPSARYRPKDPVLGINIPLRTGNAMTENLFLVEHHH